MKIALSLMVTLAVIIALFIKPLQKHRWKIMAFYGVIVTGLFIFYNVRTKDFILRFIKPTNQMFYQADFSRTDEYPDALLPYLLDGKTVIMPSLFAWDPSIKETYEHWQSGGMLYMNIENVLKENGACVKIGDYNGNFDSDRYKDDMLNLGYLNDTFRYSYFYNDLVSEYGNGFYYYWFYGANAVPFKLYFCPTDLEKEDTIYLLTDEAGLYMVPESYYLEVTNNG